MKETDINQVIQIYTGNCNKGLLLFKIGIHACQYRDTGLTAGLGGFHMPRGN